MFWRRHKFSDQLSDYIDDELSPRERDRLEAHLAACTACRRQLGELRATVDALQALPPEEAPRSFALSPGQVAPPRRVGAVAGLALPLRLAGAGLAFALAVVLVVDLADVGVDGDMAQAPAPAAERTSGDEGFEGATDLEMEPTPAAPSGREAAETPAALPSEDGGGLDPLRASEIGLAAALGVLLLGWGSLRLVAVFRRERASP